MHPLRPVRTELPSLCRTICRCCLPKVTKNLLLLLRSASLTTAHLHHLAPRSMLKGLLTLRLEDCASSHLKLAASRCSLSYAASTASCLRSRKSCRFSQQQLVLYRCSNWGERNVSTTHCASATIGTTYAAGGHELGGVYFKCLALVTSHKSTSHKLLHNRSSAT